MRMYCCCSLLFALSVAAVPAGAQVSIGLDGSAARYWGATAGSLGDTWEPASLRPHHPEAIGLRVQVGAPRLRVGLGVSYAEPDLALETAAITAATRDGFSHLELTAELSTRVARFGPTAGLNAFGGPLLSRWMLDGHTCWVAGGAVGLELEVQMSRRFAITTRGSVAAQGAPFDAATLPEGFTNTTAWRRAVGVGLRYRL